MEIKEQFKSLPLSAKRLLSLGIVVALFVALPLFVWGILTQRLDIREKAQSVPAPTPVNNAVNWNTQYVALSATNFYINIDGNNLFTGNSELIVTSDPGDDNYTSLEATWQENGTEMRLFMYFNLDSFNNWRVTEVRTYDGENPGEWLYYDGFEGNSKGNPLSANNFNLISSDNRGFIHFENLSLQPFLPLDLPVSVYGFILEPKPIYNIYMTSTQNTNSGYGVNVVLRNEDYSIVTDQSNISYQWLSSDSDIATVEVEVTESELFTHGDIEAFAPGSAIITVSAIRSGITIASATFDVFVTQGATLIPIPTATATITSSPTATPTMTTSPTATATVTATASPITITGDVNDDGIVNIVDIEIMIDYYGQTNPAFVAADLNADGIVNIVDIGIVIDNY